MEKNQPHHDSSMIESFLDDGNQASCHRPEKAAAVEATEQVDNTVVVVVVVVLDND